MDTYMKIIMLINLILVILALVKAVEEKGHTTVQTEAGSFIGEIWHIKPFENTLRVRSFLGIPYAEPPVGPLRFKKPEMKKKINQPYDATEFKPWCLQLYVDLKGKRGNFLPQFSNDCLHLNIFTPDSVVIDNPYPVMIFFHGGGFVIGGSTVYPGHILSAFGEVVVVTVQYRLGIFGFLSTGDDSLAGNYGLWDQHLAIRWVHENIAAFGGDPNKVTLFGNSAGGASVVHQALFPGNRGMFSRIITQSGSIACPWTFQHDPLKNTKRLASLVGCDTDVNTSVLANCLREIPDEKYMQVYNDPSNNFIRFPLEYGVSVDGEFVPLTPMGLLHSETEIAKKHREFFLSIDLMAGLTEDEGFLMITPIAGVDDTDTFEVNRTRFENEIVPEIVRILYGDYTPESLKHLIIAEYTDWQNPDNLDKTYNSFMRLSSDYVFNIQTVDLVKTHATTNGDNVNRYLYLLSVLPSQHILWVPFNWRGGPVHTDELPFVFGYYFDLDLTQFTHPYGQPPDPWELEMSKVIMTMWTNFAKSGDPNRPEPVLAVWPKYTRDTETYLNISHQMQVGQRLFERAHNFWLKLMPQLIKDFGLTDKTFSVYQHEYCTEDETCAP